MPRRRLLWALGAAAGVCWAIWIYIFFILNVGAVADFWDPRRVVFYLLLLLAPALSALPIALWFRWYFFVPYTVLGWAALGYILAFVPPSPDLLAGRASPLSGWYFFAALFVVLTTVLAPLAHMLGLRIWTSRTHRHDTARAWREAGLLSLYLVGMAIARSMGLITWPIVLLGLLFLALVEALFLARKS